MCARARARAYYIAERRSGGTTSTCLTGAQVSSVDNLFLGGGVVFFFVFFLFILF